MEDGTLVYYENLSVGAGAVFGPAQINYLDQPGAIIDVGQYAFPQLFDLNGDNLLDLIIGKKDGQIAYYENVGSPTTPEFVLMNNSLGGVDVSTTTPDGYASPHFFRDNNEIKLFIGSLDGVLVYYDSIENNIGIIPELIKWPKEKVAERVQELLTMVGLDPDIYSAFAVKDIDNDGNYNLFVGQDLGGLYHFEADPSSNVGLSEVGNDLLASVYPNPFANNFVVSSKERIVEISVTDMNGKLIHRSKPGSDKSTIELGQVESGLYFVNIMLESNNSVFKKIIKN